MRWRGGAERWLIIVAHTDTAGARFRIKIAHIGKARSANWMWRQEKMDDCKGVREMKYCPFMVSTATTLSLTTAGESYTNAFMEQCIGGRCVAFRPSGDGKGFCARLDNEATYEVTADG